MPSTSASEPAGIGAPDPAALARFRADLLALTGAAPDATHPLGIAVSGGPDSLALLLLAHAAFPGAVRAATVDHGLRAEAAFEAAAVHRLCERLDVPHATLVAPAEYRFEGNLQEQARALRYALLRDWSLGGGSLTARRPWHVEWVAVAHQRDDVAEGFLMRARRGAGVGGLASMQASRAMFVGLPGPLLLRPLLGWGRAELAAIVCASGLVPVEDPSNLDTRFDRVRFRGLLAATPDLPVARIAQSARNLRDAEDALAWAAEREWAARSEIENYETLWLDTASLPYELRRRLISRAIEYIRFEFGVLGDWDGSGIDRLIAKLDSGTPATLAEVLIRPGKRWKFVLAPPRRSL